MDRTHLLTRKVDAHGSLSEELIVNLERITRDTRNDDIAMRQSVLQFPPLHVNNLMMSPLQSLTTSKLLHARDVHTVYTRSIIRQQSRERASNNLRSIHHTNSAAEQTVSIRKNSIVDLEVLEDLDDGQGRARQDGLLTLGTGDGIKEADVLVHVEDVAVAQALDILGDVHDLLQVLVLSVVEDGVVYYDAVDVVVGIGGQEGILNFITVNHAESVAEATVLNA